MFVIAYPNKMIGAPARARKRIASAIAGLAVVLGSGVSVAWADSTVTVSPANPVINYTGGPFATSNPTSPVGANPPVCSPLTPCDQVALTVSIPKSDPNIYTLTVSAGWVNSDKTQSTQGANVSDFDLYVYQPDETGTKAGQGDGSTNPESTTFEVSSGNYTIIVVPFDVQPDVPFNGKIELKVVPVPTPLPTATPGGSPPPGKPGVPRYQTYMSPKNVSNNAGEPSIGINWNTEKKFSNSMFNDIPNGGTSLYFGGFLSYMLRATFDDCSSPAGITWDQIQLNTANLPRAAGDPILFTDHVTGRTFVSQLLGLTPAGSTTEFTDDDGKTFQQSEGSSAPSDIDHQTIGGGPFHDPVPPGVDPLYPHAVYYSSQSIGEARAALSVDGGRTFGPAVPLYTVAQCGGLHGHVKVGPDGTAYIPNNGCGGTDVVNHSDGEQALLVTEDNGLTWEIRTVPGSTTKGDDDPSVGVANDGKTVYIGMQSADGHPRVAVSHDHGKTWSAPFDVGAHVVTGGPVLNTTFPAVVAGDADRAAFAFYGTETGGDTYANDDFPGVWYLYIATTFDGGKTWTTQNATPGDPVQRGGICNGGLCRNLLDFFDASIDKEGRVLVGGEDGCIEGCVSGGGNSYTAKAFITRQSGGKRMFAANDPVEPVLPGAPAVEAHINAAKTEIHLTWPLPDNGGSTLNSYNVYRRAGAAGAFALIANVKEPSFTDTTFNPNVKNFYHVTANNRVGTGPYCSDIVPTSAPDTSACDLPGILTVTDVLANGADNDFGANIPKDSRFNVRALYLAEPFFENGANKLVFTVQLAASAFATPPPNSQWYIVWQRLHPEADYDRYYVAMKTDATGTPRYEYGKLGVPLNPLDPNPNANIPVPIGDADEGTYDATTGLLRITLSKSKAENITTGQALNLLVVRTFLAKNDTGPKDPRSAEDTTEQGVYTLRGNAACAVNQAPTAALVAAPTTGNPPLTVEFDGSASTDPDSGDSIGSYTFSFGDGSPNVTQANPKITHVYKHGGAFFATLTVKDSNGLQSLNVASTEIEVAAQLLNLSTRLRVQTGDNVLIGGFIVRGNQSKKVLIRGLGPSVKTDAGPVPGRLNDPVLELHNRSGATIATNDNWKDTQQSEIEASTIPPPNDRESAIVMTLSPGAYTAILRGKDNTTGVGVVEVYDIGLAANARLANISTRGFVGTGDNVMIGGFQAGPNNAAGTRVVVRAIGPSLASESVPHPLEDPMLELHDGNGALIDSNDDWAESQQAEIVATGLAPTDPRESAMLVNDVEAGPYTAIVRGKDGGKGVGLVEVYDVQN
jgi:hypothetical protein